jgi:hypothetical protein
VQPADTLDGIAELYGMRLLDLAPRVVDRTDLFLADAPVPVGTGSGARTVTIAAGSTLARTARDSGLAVADLLTAAGRVNGLLEPGALLRPRPLSRWVRVAVDYGFPLATGAAGDEILSRTPVLLVPRFLLSGERDLVPGSGFCAELAAGLGAWTATHQPPPDLGRWVLDVTVFTTLPEPDPDAPPEPAQAAGAAQPQLPPLLQLPDVQLPMDLIAPR